MKSFLFDKSKIILWIIIALVLAAAVIAIASLRTEKLSAQLKTDRPLNIMLIFEQGGKPASIQLLMFYPAKAKAALLDIPANTAVILKTIKRMDRIDFTYKKGNPKSLITEAEAYLDVKISGYMLFDEKGLSRTVDLLDGLPLFIPSMIIQDGDPPVRLPGGAVTLDGDKVLQYLAFKEEGEGEPDLLARRQKLAVSLLGKISEKSDFLGKKGVADSFVNGITSNLGHAARKKLFKELSSLTTDTILLQKITGTYRNVEGAAMFFPFYDGELARDMIKQTLNAMSESLAVASSSRIFTVEILNGTTEKGLAARTSEIFESFGYDVVAVGNHDSLDVGKTVVIDRLGDKEALTNLADVIKCLNFSDSSEYKGTIKADFTIVLGKDFNGRVCVR